jgi:hypothetical protein
MHDMIKRFYGRDGPQKFEPCNGIHSYQNPELITSSHKFILCDDVWDAPEVRDVTLEPRAIPL